MLSLHSHLLNWRLVETLHGNSFCQVLCSLCICYYKYITPQLMTERTEDVAKRCSIQGHSCGGDWCGRSGQRSRRGSIMNILIKKFNFFFCTQGMLNFRVAEEPPSGARSSLFRLHDHTQRHLPDNTHKRQDIHVPGGIRTRSPSKRAATVMGSGRR